MSRLDVLADLPKRGPETLLQIEHLRVDILRKVSQTFREVLRHFTMGHLELTQEFSHRPSAGLAVLRQGGAALRGQLSAKIAPHALTVTAKPLEHPLNIDCSGSTAVG
jgi:hypothetical protein